MSLDTVPYQIYKINKKIFTQSKLQVLDSQITAVDRIVHPTETFYGTFVTQAILLLTGDSTKQFLFNRLLEQLPLAAKPRTVANNQVSPDMQRMFEEIQKLNKQFMTTSKDTPAGVNFLRLSKIVYEEKRNYIDNVMKALGGDVIPVLQLTPTLTDYDNIVRCVASFYEKMSASLGGASVNNTLKLKCDQINKDLTPLLFKNMLYISSTHRGMDVQDEMRRYNLFNEVVWRVIPTVHRIALVMNGTNVEHTKVAVPRYLEMIHADDDNILAINTNLLSYLKDMGISDVPQHESVADLRRTFADAFATRGNTAYIEQLQHYANDMYQTFKLVVRHTFLYQFRSSITKNPDGTSHTTRGMTEGWNSMLTKNINFAKYAKYETFLNELLFFSLDTFIGGDVATYDGIKRALEAVSNTQYLACTLKTALGEIRYVEFLKEAAMDSSMGKVQVRTETLLKFMSFYAFDALGSVGLLEVVKSDTYNGILSILDAVAEHVVRMQPIIFSVFHLLNTHHTEFLEETPTLENEILTFIKIRNDNQDFGNRRFDIFLDKQATTLMMTYEDIDVPCYGKLRDWKAAVKTAVASGDAVPAAPAYVYAQKVEKRETAHNERLTRKLADAQRNRASNEKKAAKDAAQRVMDREMAQEKSDIDQRAEKYKQIKRRFAKEAALNADRIFVDQVNNSEKASVRATLRLSEKQVKDKLIADYMKAHVKQGIDELSLFVPLIIPDSISNPTGEDKSGQPNDHIESFITISNKNINTLLDESKPGEAYDPAMIVQGGPKTTFMFGPVTRVYTVKENAQQIASDPPSSTTMDATVIKRLKSGQDVCVFGYGQSGSGKTSLLIYLKTNPDDSGEDGIMSRLCEKMQGDYAEIECTIREIGVVKVGTNGKASITNSNVSVVGDENPFYRPKIFTLQNQKWVMQTEDFAKLPPLARIQKTAAGESSTINPTKLRDLASFCYFSTENNRLTRATTNNPTSSRSHIFIFLKFKRPLKGQLVTPTMVIGDFAGVENKFACHQASVIKEFAEIKFDNRNEFVYKNKIDAGYKKLFAGSTLLRDVQLNKKSVFEVPFSTIEMQTESSMSKLNLQIRTKLISTIGDLLASTKVELARSVALAQTTMGRLITQIKTMQQNKPSPPSRFILSVEKSKFNLCRENGGDLIYRALASRFPVGPKTPQTLRTLVDEKKINHGDEINAGTILALLQLYNTDETGTTLLDQFLYYMLKALSQLVLVEDCNERVVEGKYINSSLDIFKNFLSNSLKKKGAVPKILSQCGAIQCNPFYSDCFGSSFSNAQMILDAVEETLVAQLAKNPSDVQNITSAQLTAEARYLLAQKVLANLTYCVFNVINISKDRNDPPPSPFIDTTPVVFEYNRFTSFAGASPDVMFAQSRGDPEFDVSVLQNLRRRTVNRASLSGNVDLTAAANMYEGTKGEVVKLIDEALAAFAARALKKDTSEKVLQIINEFDKINDPSLMGTMIFTDGLAKFGINRMMCVLESTAYGKHNNFVDNMTFNSMRKLNKSAQQIACTSLLRQSANRCIQE